MNSKRNVPALLVLMILALSSCTKKTELTPREFVKMDTVFIQDNQQILVSFKQPLMMIDFMDERYKDHEFYKENPGDKRHIAIKVSGDPEPSQMIILTRSGTNVRKWLKKIK